MLTADLGMSWRRGDRIAPRYVETERAPYPDVAADLLAIVGEHRGRPRHELEAAMRLLRRRPNSTRSSCCRSRM